MSDNCVAPRKDKGRETVLVYIPRPGSPIEQTVKHGSAIVGPESKSRQERTTVYFEGNLHGVGSMVTFADCAMHAYWRMRECYPTVAKMAVLAHDLVRVGTLDSERGVIRDELDARGALLAWLGIKDVPGDRRILSLQRELCVLAVSL